MKNNITIILSILLLSGVQLAGQSLVQQVQNHSIAFHSVEDFVVRPADVVGDRATIFLAFDRPLLKSAHEDLKANKVELLDYYGEGTYLASVPADFRFSSLRNGQSVMLAHLDSDQKVPENFDIEAAEPYAQIGEFTRVLLRYSDHLSFSSVEARLLESGCQDIVGNGHNNFCEVNMPTTSWKSLLAKPFILGINHMPALPIADDKSGRNLHRVNRLNGSTGAARNYTGAGVSVSVRDDGEVFDHIDFRGRNDQSSVGESRGSHGDGVAGILCGAGNLDPINQGMAYGAFMYVQDYTASFLDETIDLHQDQGVLVTNSSYSNGCNDGYTFTTNIVDQQMRENPTLMHVFSAGNDGQSNCGYGAGNEWGNITGGHKIGKNVIAVANLDFLGNVVESSSRGPARDGRIKPDIAANGFEHISTDESQDYMTFGGTSAAAPVVAGVTAILQEAHQDLFGEPARGALLKAVMLNTANDLGNKGPDFKYGWGSVNAHRAVLAFEENRFMTGTISQDEVLTFDIPVPQGAGQLKVMTYWPDREGSVNQTQHLTTDLDITLSDGTETFMPWILDHTPDPTKLDAPATTGEDHKNNMEQVAIDNPTATSYTLAITGNDVPFADNEFYVVWEFLSEEIEITYPIAGDHMDKNSLEEIHWDAAGDDGFFTIELIDHTDTVIASRTVSGDQRLVRFPTPDQYIPTAKIRVSRDGFMDESNGTFLIADYISNLRNTDGDEGNVLSWDTIPDAESYNIHLMGDVYMEQVTNVQTPTFAIPEGGVWEVNFIAVSPVFLDGREGTRSRAISTRQAPVPVIELDVEGNPCIDEVVTFSTPTLDTLTTYKWSFGVNATPDSASTAGPHEVTYSNKGVKVVTFIAANEAGQEGTAVVVTVQDDPSGDKLTIDEKGTGFYEFTSNAKRVDDYLWDFGDGATASGEEVGHSYSAPGTYTVQLTASGRCGEVVITDEVVVLATNIEDLTAASFEISPNPSDGNFQVSIPDLEGESISVEIYSMNGKLIKAKHMSKPVEGTIIEFNEDLNQGLYLININVGARSIQKRISVQ